MTAELRSEASADTRTSPQRAALLALHAERAEIERALALAQQRQLYSPDPVDALRAEADEQALLADLDRILTSIRAAEYRTRPNARLW